MMHPAHGLIFLTKKNQWVAAVESDHPDCSVQVTGSISGGEAPTVELAADAAMHYAQNLYSRLAKDAAGYGVDLGSMRDEIRIQAVKSIKWRCEGGKLVNNKADYLRNIARNAAREGIK